MRGRVAGWEYRRVWEDEMEAAGIFVVGKVFDDIVRTFVRESVGCQITLEGAANEARMLIEEINELMSLVANDAMDSQGGHP